MKVDQMRAGISLMWLDAVTWRDVLRTTEEELLVRDSTFKRIFRAATDRDDEGDQIGDKADDEAEFFENLDSAKTDAKASVATTTG